MGVVVVAGLVRRRRLGQNWGSSGHGREGIGTQRKVRYSLGKEGKFARN